MIAYMFPGQGSQFNGMGAGILERYPDVVQEAERCLGYPISEICLAKDDRRINEAHYTQPAIYLVSCLAYMDAVARAQREPEIVLGHSLGLYAALYASKAFSLIAGLRIVSKRAELMATAEGGAMLAVVGEEVDRVPGILVQHDCTDVDIANYNSPTQLVLSGLVPGVEKAKSVMEKSGFRCLRLPVSGAFHSRYMEQPRIKFCEYLLDHEFSDPALRVVSSTSAANLSSKFMLEELSFQFVRPVRWYQTVRFLRECYPNLKFSECGPGEVLTKLEKSI